MKAWPDMSVVSPVFEGSACSKRLLLKQQQKEEKKHAYFSHSNVEQLPKPPSSGFSLPGSILNLPLLENRLLLGTNS